MTRPERTPRPRRDAGRGRPAGLVLGPVSDLFRVWGRGVVGPGQVPPLRGVVGPGAATPPADTNRAGPPAPLTARRPRSPPR